MASLRAQRAGLLDANTNLTYAVPYLANAYRVASGNAERAVSLIYRAAGVLLCAQGLSALKAGKRDAAETEKRSERASKAQGRPLDVPDPEPWPEPAHGAERLEAMLTMRLVRGS